MASAQAVAKIAEPASVDDAINILGNSLYPGAKRESIELVLSYCRFNHLDPMLKVVHIVPTSVKVQSNPDRWEMRDVLMPGIADYRIKAARTGEYAGKSEPEFGPDKTQELDGVRITFPQWCRMTVWRIVGGQPRAFVAKEFWTENYATKARNSAAPNSMWCKRAYGQLGKVAEAQALRMAFPEFSGGQPTAEEMEGKTFDGPTIDAQEPREQLPPPVSLAVPPPARPHRQTVHEWLDELGRDLERALTRADVEEIGDREQVIKAQSSLKNGALTRFNAMMADAIERTAPLPASDGPQIG